jgi:hypothetical protein
MKFLDYRFARVSILALFPTLWGISVLNMAAQPAAWVTKQVNAGDIQVELTYPLAERIPNARRINDQPSKSGTSGTSGAIRLKISQAGQPPLETIVPRQKPTDQPIVNGIHIRDLDHDRQPEVIVDFYTGGSHCCYYSLIYHRSAASGTYQPTQHNWGNGLYRLVDLNQESKPVFSSQDDRFTGRFSSTAAAGDPSQIWRFEQGRMVNVTRQFPLLLEQSATRNLMAIQTASHQQQNAKGAIAAYLADKHSQGKGAEGWQLIEQLYQADDKEKFFGDLKTFLQETGYGTS